MIRGPASTWFDTLRRDRSLFVLLASFIMLLQAMQPLALASQATGGGHFVICTEGEVDPLHPQLHVDCSKCIASVCRVIPLAAPDIADPMAFVAPDAAAIDWPASARLPRVSRPATSLPPARAPPALA